MIQQYWAKRPVMRAILGVFVSTTLAFPPMALADVTLNFANADIDQIARAIGAATGKTIIVDPRVKGTLTLQSERPVPDDQALKTLQASLRMQGFALLQDHGVLKVVPEADAKLQGVPTFVGNTPQAKGDTVITQVFQLKNESANNLLPVLRPLISPNNTVAAYPANNTIVVTDYADNVRRIASIIAGIDTVAGADIEVIPMVNGNAVDIATTAAKLLDPGAIGSTDTTLKVNVTADSRTNSVILRASNSVRMTMAKNLIHKLDAPTREPGNMHVVPVINADATQLAKTLRGMLGQSSGSSSKADGSSLFGASSASTGSSSSAGLGSSGSGVPPLPSGTGSTSSLGSASYGSGSTSGSGHGSDSSSDDSSSGGGMIQADAATNSLIITAPEAVYRNLRNVIDKLDARRVQVYIESLIMEVTTNNSGSLGIEWLNQNGSFFSGTSYPTTGTGGIANANTNIVTNASVAGGGLLGAGTSLAGGGLSLGFTKKFGSILGVGGLLQAVAGTSGTNVLSTPNLITLDNQTASILVGQNVPVISGSIAQAVTSGTTAAAYNTYNRIDVGTALKVRPQISQGGTIKLEIYQEDSSVVSSTTSTANGANSAGPTINKRTLQTTVLADDGEIVVLGGLISDNYQDANSKVPWLGDLPVIGSLFRTENKSRTKTNLMIFLRPVIIRDEDALRQVSLNRYDYMRAQSANYKSDNRLIRDKVVPEAPPIESGSTPDRYRGLLDWNKRETDPNAPPMSPNVTQQPPYSPDPVPAPAAQPVAQPEYPRSARQAGPLQDFEARP
jgi:general secretion pathway protein D